MCIACGVCAGICPEHCIKMSIDQNVVHAEINDSLCVNCGKCVKFCPSNDFGFETTILQNTDYLSGLAGSCYKAYIAKAKDEEIRNNATSGGSVTAIIKELLNKGEYDSAFLVKGYAVDCITELCRVVIDNDLSGTQQSRYVTVSHEHFIKYIINNPNEKVIVVSTSCAVHSIRKIIKKEALNADNYLLLGLFCDKTMTNGVFSYFSEYPELNNEKLISLHFRTKENSKWPGNVKLITENGRSLYLRASERIAVKDYYMPRRCLYCMDKLNTMADISFGDNYVSNEIDLEGSNSVVIRTHIGEQAWNICNNSIIAKEIALDKIVKSQGLRFKLFNAKNAEIDGVYHNNCKILKCDLVRHKEKIKGIILGEKGDFSIIKQAVLKNNHNNGIFERFNKKINDNYSIRHIK